MKQILQNMKNGLTEVIELPKPAVSDGTILVRSTNSLISSGTERMLVDFGNANYLNKALKQPAKVKTVLDKIKTDGFKPTFNAVISKLEEPMPMGYSNVGIVAEVGANIPNIKVGDRVLSNGSHAEIVKVPKNFFVKIPENVLDEEAVFGVVGSIALQSIRLAVPTLGERVVVFGLGLIGLMTVQILKANGCQVLGVDYDNEKIKLAESFGAETVNLTNGEDPVVKASYFSDFKGVDIVIIAADSKTNKIIEQASHMSRKRGRIILSGVVGLHFNRQDFYEKELTFQVSCSYGPGRYDVQYEKLGIDYPISFVRWTAQRNFEAVLKLMSDRRLDVRPLISHAYKIEEAKLAYKKLLSSEKTLGILIKYNSKKNNLNNETLKILNKNNTDNKKINNLKISFIGSGNYVRSTLALAFYKSAFRLKSISSRSGLSSYNIAKKYSFEEVTTNVENIFIDNEINAVVIATQHNTHADYINKALKANKHIFVEKPLCLSHAELKIIKKTYNEIIKIGQFKPLLMVGFNRRFSPLIIKTKELLRMKQGPKSVVITVNAGSIPGDHWTQDLNIGGGRINGEVCHFIDLARFIIDCSIVNQNLICMKSELNDTLSISLSFRDGSIATIHYFANGSKSVSKERIEIYASNGVLQINNFKELKVFGWDGSKNKKLWSQDKGQNACVEAFANSILNNEENPIPIDEIFEVTDVTLKLAEMV